MIRSSQKQQNSDMGDDNNAVLKDLSLYLLKTNINGCFCW